MLTHLTTLTLSRSISMTIYLYVKQHQITGLKYFGKTTRNPLTYKGSGKYWIRHCKKHGYSIDTLEVWEFSCEEQCKEFAFKYSQKHNIVESSEWANLIPEDGVNIPPTALGKKRSPESIERSRISRTGVKRSDEFREKLRALKIGKKLGPASESRKQKMSEARVGKYWFTNQDRSQQLLCESGNEPDGWVRGMKIRKKPTPGLKRNRKKK